MDTDERQIVDELLAIEAQCGDAACLELLLRRRLPQIRTMVRHRVGVHHDLVDDIVQEVCLAIARHIRRLHDPASLGAWIASIVRARCVDAIRRSARDRRRTRAIQESPPPQPVDASQDGDTLLRLRAAIRMLAPEQQTILRLLYQEGLRITQIAQILDIPTGTAKSRLHAARRTLQSLIATASDDTRR